MSFIPNQAAKALTTMNGTQMKPAFCNQSGACCDDQGRRDNPILPQAPDNCDSIDARKHAIDRHHGIFSRTSAAQSVVAVDSEIDLIAARGKRIHELLGRLAVVLDDENATPPSCHVFASPSRCPNVFDRIILP
jgi:hypothetical protein